MKFNKSKKIIINTIFYGLMSIFIFISLIMIKAKINGTQPSILGNKFFIVLTGSMSPTIDVGDMVIVKDVKPEAVNVNDVITFGSNSSDNVTTHRVKEVLSNNENLSYITQGDANNVEDPTPVEEDFLVGRVNKVIPKVGKIILWVKGLFK